MKFKNSNEYKIIFKDGTFVESSGSASSIKKSKIENELNCVSYYMLKSIYEKGKTLEDVKEIQYNLKYED